MNMNLTMFHVSPRKIGSVQHGLFTNHYNLIMHLFIDVIVLAALIIRFPTEWINNNAIRNCHFFVGSFHAHAIFFPLL